MDSDCDNIIWGGDLNVNLSELDKKGGEFTLSRAVKFLNSFLDESEWLDVWRYFHGDEFQFTW